ncbi:hypothetical protein, partial [Nocardioides sp.]|uniref:hypothetical protein n=1 Tax=Nocardioides sp. TaxID=35761 RepID=UPI002732CABF
VAGLEPGGSATLTATGQGVLSLPSITLDRRCQTLGLGRASCRVSEDPESFVLVVNAVPGTGATLVVTVTPDPGTADADPTNNTVVVQLGA